MQTKDSYLQRERLIKAIRAFFDTHGFHEIIAPVLNDTIPAETNIHPFETTWKTINGDQKKYLSTSPERALKKALASGLGNCYSIGHSFRNLEQAGPHHSPEFLMLEWYRENATYVDIMKDVQDLFHSLYSSSEHSESRSNSIGSRLRSNTSDAWETISFLDLFSTHVGVSLESIIGDEALFSLAKEKGYSTENTTWHDLFDQIFLNEIEPNLPKTPFFLTDFPARISRLCKPQIDKPYLAERFEVYVNGIEIGNGNTENTDVESIKKYFTEKNNTPVDEEFLSALKKMKDKNYAGIGIGVDRLGMIFEGI